MPQAVCAEAANQRHSGPSSLLGFALQLQLDCLSVPINMPFALCHCKENSDSSHRAQAELCSVVAALQISSVFHGLL